MNYGDFLDKLHLRANSSVLIDGLTLQILDLSQWNVNLRSKRIQAIVVFSVNEINKSYLLPQKGAIETSMLTLDRDCTFNLTNNIYFKSIMKRLSYNPSNHTYLSEIEINISDIVDSYRDKCLLENKKVEKESSFDFLDLD